MEIQYRIQAGKIHLTKLPTADSADGDTNSDCNLNACRVYCGRILQVFTAITKCSGIIKA